jgi:DNA-binding response OmpR family regulator
MFAEQNTLPDSQPAVIIVAPQDKTSQALADNLRAAGCSVRMASDRSSAMECMDSYRPQVVLLSQDLPEDDPWDVCRHIQSQAIEPPPVFVLTPPASQSSPLDPRAAAPGFPPTPNVDRLTRVLRALADCSADATHVEETISRDGLEIDFGRHRCTCNGVDLRLTPTEFRLLGTLARHPGRVFSRQQLTLASCGNSQRTQVRTIDAHVKSIRVKLGPQSALIETVHGVGYRFSEGPPAREETSG